MRLILIIVFVFISKMFLGQQNYTSNEWFEKYIEYNNLDSKDLTTEFNHLDFSNLFTEVSTFSIYGIISNNFQRIQIKWISINKDPQNPSNYYVYGKTKVKNNISEFTGLIKIKTVRLYKEGKYDMPYRSKVNPEKIGVLFCDYLLVENKNQPYTGIFKGISATEFYINNDTLFYNKLRSASDDMTNNQFVGEWNSYSSKNSKICNWGDYRVPNVSGFDCGASEFAPCNEYLKNGWTDFYNANFLNDSVAIKEEYKEWWK